MFNRVVLSGVVLEKKTKEADINTDYTILLIESKRTVKNKTSTCPIDVFFIGHAKTFVDTFVKKDFHILVEGELRLSSGMHSILASKIDILSSPAPIKKSIGEANKPCLNTSQGDKFDDLDYVPESSDLGFVSPSTKAAKNIKMDSQ